MGAGIGAIFKAPLGGAILSAEILYIRDFELAAIVPGFIASVVGYTIFGAWAGWTPVFGEPVGLRFKHPESLVWYAVLGVAAGAVGILYVPSSTARAMPSTASTSRRTSSRQSADSRWADRAVATRSPPDGIRLDPARHRGTHSGACREHDGRAGVPQDHRDVLHDRVRRQRRVFAPGLFIGGMLGGAMWGILHGHVAWSRQHQRRSSSSG